MTDKPSNIIQFPVQQGTKPEDPHPRNSSVYVHKDSSAVLLDGEECLTFCDFAFIHRDASGELMVFGRFDTIEEAKHAGAHMLKLLEQTSNRERAGYGAIIRSLGDVL